MYRSYVSNLKLKKNLNDKKLIILSFVDKQNMTN